MDRICIEVLDKLVNNIMCNGCPRFGAECKPLRYEGISGEQVLICLDSITERIKGTYPTVKELEYIDIE
jgi:hypothetical protein